MDENLFGMLMLIMYVFSFLGLNLQSYQTLRLKIIEHQYFSLI